MQRTIELDRYAGRAYFLVVRGEPDLHSPDEWAVTVYYKDADSEQTHAIARIDTEHGHVHIDKLYLAGEPREPIDLGMWEAVEHMIEHHPEYARRYRNKHQ